MFSSEEVAESSTFEILIDNALSFDSEFEYSATSSESKLNPLAKSFETLNKNILLNPFSSSHGKQFRGMQSKETEVACGINFAPFCDDVSLEMSIPNPLLNCTPQIINDAMTPDISMRSDPLDKTSDSLQITDISVSAEVSIMVQGKQESTIEKFLLDPCAEPFLPKDRTHLHNLTQPAVVEQIKTDLIDPKIVSFSATQNSNLITQIENNMDPKEIMECLKIKHRDRPIIAHLNINFLDPKFEPLRDIIKDNVDILLVSETKINESYPEGRFFIEGYKEPIRLDRNKNGGGLMFFIHDDLECKEIKSHKLPKKTEGTFLKLTIRNTKWLIFGGYNPKKENIKNFLDQIGKELDRFLPNYENLLLLGDFNSEMCEEHMKDFCETYNLTNLITDPTCFKSINNPSCIDVMLTNRNSCFENSMVVETGLSDFHKMTITVMKKYLKKREPVTITYRDYKLFDGEKFRTDLKEKIIEADGITIDKFINIFNELLDKHAPRKQKVTRGNSAPFMNSIESFHE